MVICLFSIYLSLPYPHHSVTSRKTTLAVFSPLIDTSPVPVISWGGSKLFVLGNIAHTNLYDPRVIEMHVVECLTILCEKIPRAQSVDIGEGRCTWRWS